MTRVRVPIAPIATGRAFYVRYWYGLGICLESAGIFQFASHVNHCWRGNAYARSEAADLTTVDEGLGAYYR
jgi:hypothetical protein